MAAEVLRSFASILVAGLLSVLATGSSNAQYVDVDLPVTDGPVYALASSGDTLFIGGHFTMVGPATGSIVTIDASGSVIPPNVKVAGSVLAMASDGAGGWFLGGSFVGVNGIPRFNLCHVLADGTLSLWSPRANKVVFALARLGNTLYVGGSFDTLGTSLRGYLGAIDVGTGQVLSWNPFASSRVLALAASGETVYAGGEFTTVGGQSRRRIAAIHVSGTVLPWNPRAVTIGFNGGTVQALLVHGSTVFAGGVFDSIGGQIRKNVAALDAATGLSTSWNPNSNGGVHSFAVHGSSLVVGGYFTSIGGQPRQRLAMLDLGSGSANSWNPGSNDDVTAIVSDGTTIYVGGYFYLIAGQERIRLAAFDGQTGALLPWNPVANGGVRALSLEGGLVHAAGYFTSVGAQVRCGSAAIRIGTNQVLPWPKTLAANAAHAIVATPTTVFVGGWTNSNCSGYLMRAVNRSTANVLPWNPAPDAVIDAMTALDGRLYVSGDFSQMAFQIRHHAAAFDLASLALNAWNPAASSGVTAMVQGDSVIYLGGDFSSVGGQARNCAAALDPVSGLATAWNPNVSNDVLSICPSSGSVYLGGIFGSVGGQARSGLAAVGSSTGTVLPWAPSQNGVVYAIAEGSRLYVGGTFSSIAGLARTGVAAFDRGTGDVLSWNARLNGSVRALLTRGTDVIVGGDFTQASYWPRGYLSRFTEESAGVTPTITTGSSLITAIRPHPAREVSSVSFNLLESTVVDLSVFDAAGRRVAEIARGRRFTMGTHLLNVHWGNLPSGIYFLRLCADDRVDSRRVVHLR